MKRVGHQRVRWSVICLRRARELTDVALPVMKAVATNLAESFEEGAAFIASGFVGYIGK
jgi:hypothetical protein